MREEVWHVLLKSTLLSNATHPCLLSSSGSGPAELEHKAQLLSEQQSFTLRAKKKKKKNRFSTSQIVPFSFSEYTKTRKNRTQVAALTQSALYNPPPICVASLIFFFRNLFCLEIDVSFLWNISDCLESILKPGKHRWGNFSHLLTDRRHKSAGWEFKLSFSQEKLSKGLTKRIRKASKQITYNC